MTGTRYFEEGQKTTPSDLLQFPLPDVRADWKRHILNMLQPHHHYSRYPFRSFPNYGYMTLYYLLIESILTNNLFDPRVYCCSYEINNIII